MRYTDLEDIDPDEMFDTQGHKNKRMNMRLPEGHPEDDDYWDCEEDRENT